jgi:predicted PurR-regulated permease PerM
MAIYIPQAGRLSATIPRVDRYRTIMHDPGDQQSRLNNGRRGLPLAIDDPVPIKALSPAWRRAAQAATIGIFIILLVVALSLARAILLPAAVAFVITMMLGPMSARADRHHLPAPLTALVLWLLVAAVFYGLVALVSSPVVAWVGKAPDIGRSIQDKLQLLDAPLAGLRDMRNALLPSQNGKGIEVDFVAIAQGAVSIVTPALGQILIFFITLFFMLLGRNRIRVGLVALFHEREARLRMLKIMSDIERNLTGYLSVVAVINLGVGLVAAAIAWAVGLPDPVAWGVLGFVLNFIPYIGATIMELGMFLVGLVAFPALLHAFIAPLLFLSMALLEGQVLTPSIVGRRFTLNPLTVFLSLVFWAWLWGPVGAFLAVPLLIMGMVVVAHVFPKDEVELPD